MPYTDPIQFVYEKIDAANRILALAREEAREKLRSVAINNLLVLYNIEQPPELHQKYIHIMTALYSSGSFPDSIGDLSDEEVQRIVDMIMDYANSVQKEYEKVSQ